MFTGLIEATGEVVDVTPRAGGFHLRVATELAADLAAGESVAVNGVCLTVTSTRPGEFETEIGPETAEVTTLGSLDGCRRLNLERPLRADGRFGGHFVQGHVDAIGIIDDLRRESECLWVTVSFPPRLSPYIVDKGSIAVDGISLTVARLHGSRFDVQVIPYTTAHTSLGVSKAGDPVNLECDMVGKYVVRAAELAMRNAR